jgi:diguanylate cyclase (GGDEF)-like protein
MDQFRADGEVCGTGGRMSPAEQESVPLNSMLTRAEDIQQQIQQLSGRDLQLWSIGVLVILMLTAGLLAFVAPNLMWAQGFVRIQHAYLPQLFYGLISLVVLFNIYLVAQKNTLNATRHALIRELVLNERLESLSLIDPLTQLPNRRAMNELIPREAARANRLGNSLAFLSIDLTGFRQINIKFGAIEADTLLMEFAKILKRVFRGGDLVFRQGGDEFLIVMPDTTEEQADFPMQRLYQEMEQWNLNSKKNFELSFTWALAPHVTGTDCEEALRVVDRKLYQKKHNLVPVF